MNCPNCGGPTTSAPAYPGSHYDPPEPERLYCESCNWEAEGWEIDYYKETG